MGLTLRLIFALAFALWVLPKIVMFMGGPDSLDPSRLLQKHDQLGRDITAGLNADSEKLIATLDDLSIHDAGLRLCILNEMKRLYGGNAKHVTELNLLLCDNMGINSLQGIARIKNLKSLSLRNNNISSIAGLTSLDNLESLDLYGNPEIDDFTNLRWLAKLKHLSVSNLAGTYCYKVEEVLEHVKNNQSGFGAGTSVSAMTRNIQCRGKANSKTEYLSKKKDRGERLTIDERRQLHDYESDQRRR